MNSRTSSQMSSDTHSRGSVSRRRVRFERHPSQVMFDPASSQFVVTWSKCGKPESERLASRRDPMTWIPSVGAVATLFDRGRIPQGQVVYAAMAIGRAWKDGDRDMLDTEEAKKAAELVYDLSSMCKDPLSPSCARDIGQAIRRLLDEMAAVSFMGVKPEELEDAAVLPSLEKATRECLSTDGFVNWTHSSMRRRFLYCLNRKERTKVAYTLTSLLFDTGSCPLLSLTDRRTLRMIAFSESGLVIGFTVENTMAFFGKALAKMREMKADGRSSLGERMTQQQFSDSVCPACDKTDNNLKKGEKQCNS